MRKKKKVEKIVFKDYYKELDKKRKEEIRSEFLQASGLSHPAFYSKLSRGNFSKLELKELGNICGTEFENSND